MVAADSSGLATIGVAAAITVAALATEVPDNAIRAGALTAARIAITTVITTAGLAAGATTGIERRAHNELKGG